MGTTVRSPPAASARLAVLSHNDSDVFKVRFACQHLGAIFLPLDWRLAIPQHCRNRIVRDEVPKEVRFLDEPRTTRPEGSLSMNSRATEPAFFVPNRERPLDARPADRLRTV